MAWCLTAPSHYLNQCWLIISEETRGKSHGKWVKKIKLQHIIQWPMSWYHIIPQAELHVLFPCHLPSAIINLCMLTSCMEAFSALLAICGGNVPSQMVSNADLWYSYWCYPQQQSDKQSKGWWFKTPKTPRRLCDLIVTIDSVRLWSAKLIQSAPLLTLTIFVQESPVFDW